MSDLITVYEEYEKDVKILKEIELLIKEIDIQIKQERFTLTRSIKNIEVILMLRSIGYEVKEHDNNMYEISWKK